MRFRTCSSASRSRWRRSASSSRSTTPRVSSSSAFWANERSGAYPDVSARAVVLADVHGQRHGHGRKDNGVVEGDESEAFHWISNVSRRGGLSTAPRRFLIDPGRPLRRPCAFARSPCAFASHILLENLRQPS